MNTRLKIALIRRYSDQGFAMPIAIGMGFIMLLIAATLMMRSQGDQTTATVQKNTAQSLTVAEGGIARSLFKLQQQNSGAYLALNFDPLNTAASPQKTFLGPNGILNDGDGETTTVDQWLSPPNPAPCTPTGSIPSGLRSGTIGTGSTENYTIKAYRYRNPDGIPRSGDETGTLLIDGDHSSAKSQVQVTIPIVQNAITGSFPGLYASNSVNLGNNDVLRATGSSGSAANIICKDCVVPVAQCSGNKPTQAGLETAVGKSNNGVIDGNIYIGDPQLPPLPTAPTTACSATSGPNCSINLGAITSDITLPRDGTDDVTYHTPGQPFHYVVTSINLGNNKLTVNTNKYPHPLTANAAAGANSISVDSASGYAVNTKLQIGSDTNIYTISNISGTTLTITPSLGTAQTSGAVVQRADRDPVYLYVSGNISLGGNGAIAHTGKPADLRLYGRPADNDSVDQEITISGGSSASSIFIYAPDALVGINGGSNDPDILGAVWAKKWNGSNSNNADIKVPDDMPMQLRGSFSGAGMQIFSSGPPSTWQRQPVSQ